MRLLVTADLHYNHRRSRPLADALIDEINRLEADALLVVGDTAPAESPELAQCLSRFQFPGPRLFVPGNHELWTHSDDSHALLTSLLPQRLAELRWHDLQSQPYITSDGHFAVVGNVGWYDYSFASPALALPKRFYEHKLSPAAAAQSPTYAHLVEGRNDIPPSMMDFYARWNDGRFVKLHRGDEQFLDELLERLRSQLHELRGVRHVAAAIHHLPFAELLPPHPPPGGAQWQFVRAYLGSPKIGRLLAEFPNVRTVLCGHSHFPAEATTGSVHAINLGSGYRAKPYRLLDLAA